MSVPFQRDYLIRLPLPLAQLYARAYNAKDARGRHDNTFYLLEALIKLATAPAIAAYVEEIRQGAPHVAAIDENLARLALPSLGQWVAMLRELARHFGTRAPAHPLGPLWDQLNAEYRGKSPLLQLYRRIKNGPDGEPAGDRACTPLELFDALVQYRNGVFGHGGARFGSFYEREMGPLLLPAVNELLAEGSLDILGPPGSRLVYLGDLRIVDADRVEVELRELVGLEGEPIDPLALSKSQAAGLVPNRVAVLWPGRAAPLRLDPLLLYRESDVAPELLFLNRDRDGRQVEYLNYRSGRTERDLSTVKALQELLARVLDHEVGESQFVELIAESLAATEAGEAVAEPAEPAAWRLGEFEVLAEIGRGGMGVVYLARQMSLGRLVAVKVLADDLGDDELALARFRREVRALARCDHANIVKVLATGTLPDGRLYYAMEYVPGSDLEQVWQELSCVHGEGDASSLGGSTWAQAVLSASRKRREQTARRRARAPGLSPAVAPQPTRPEATEQVALAAAPPEPVPPLPLPPLPELPSVPDDPGGYARRVAALVRDAALAVQAVHDQGIIHRDIKPANLMLTPDGTRVVLMDFGLAKGQSLSLSTARAGGLLGTLRYAAPEQLAAAALEVGPEADVRGLGVTLWELLTRRRLFAEAQDEARLARMVYEEDVPRLRSIDRGLGPDLEAIVARATERRVADRIPKAGLLAEYLQLYLDGRPLPIRPPTTPEMVRRWVGAHRPLVGSIAASVLAIVATVIVAFVLIVQSRNEKIGLASKYASLANKNAVLAINEKKARDESDRRSRQNAELTREARRRLAQFSFERGLTLCNQANFPHSCLWLASSLAEIAREPNALDDEADASLERLIRLNLSSCRAHFCALRSRLEHERGVEAVAFSPDDKAALTGSDDKTARLWDAATGQPIGQPLQHQGIVRAVAFRPDGKAVLTGSWDGTARLWDAATGQPIGQPLQHQNQVRAVAFCPDGKAILTGAGNTARIWDAATGQPIGQPLQHQGEVIAVAFSRDGEAVLTGAGNTARLWDAATGQPIGQPMQHQDQVQAVAFSPDGKTILTGAGKTARLWDRGTGQPIGQPMQHHDMIFSVAFSLDGKTLLTGSWDRTARLWVAATGQAIGEPLQHQDLNAVAISSDGKTVLTGGGYTARLWDAATGRPIGQPMQHQNGVHAVAFSSDGKAVLTGRALWEAATGQSIGQPMYHQDKVLAVAFAPDGKAVLTGSVDHTARLWDAATGQPIGLPMQHRDTVSAVAFSPDGKTALTGSWDHTARLWDAATGQPIGLPMQHRDTVFAVAFSPDGKTVLTGSWDTTARLWDAGTGQPIGRPMQHLVWLQALAFSPDGKKVLTECGDSSARLWDAATGQPIGEPMQHQNQVRAVAFSPDGKMVLTGGGYTARLWDAATGRPIGQPMQHQNGVLAVAFSPDGKAVLTGSEDYKARLWNAATGQPIGHPMQHENKVIAVAFSPDGKAILTGSMDHTARLWDAATSQPIGQPMRHESGVNAVAFSPDGKSVLTGSEDHTARLWAVPGPMEGSAERIVLWAQVSTEQELDSNGSYHPLDAQTWRQRQQRLQELGGPSKR